MLRIAIAKNVKIRGSKGIGCLLLALFSIALNGAVNANDVDAGFTNPILRGSYPDPSICRMDDDFYVVNSSFEYFPGLPIHHSKDLVNWELIGYGLHRPEQASAAVNLVDVQSDGGIHAPSIRCHDDQFYIITTNVYSPSEPGVATQMVNFVITADDPAGPWSQPHVIEGAPGIDPDLFFESDGTVWYVGNHAPANPAFQGEGEIWLQQLDPTEWKLIGERYFLWRGALKGAIWAEGPHIYKKHGRYYLMIAEGGTSFDHAVTVASSHSLTGPYAGNSRNPILTSRHLSYDNWVNSTGHADLVELKDGRWYAVALGIRNDISRRSNMGRESHLIPVTWEQEPYEWKAEKLTWPVFAPLSGRVERKNPSPFPQTSQNEPSVFVDHFDQPVLGLDWNFRRVPKPDLFSLQARDGFLRLYTDMALPRNRGRASLMGIRQTETNFEYIADMNFEPSNEGSQAGIALFQKDDNYVRFTVAQNSNGYQIAAHMREAKSERETSLAILELPDYQGTIRLRIDSDKASYDLSYSLDAGHTWVEVATISGNKFISRGYTGAYLGLIATSQDDQPKDFADFDWVKYAPRP
ncbi:MAG: glycoside hydrolase family 43 protein [Halieaceae bacterium]|nr:glycoside hydrolase family 43 protein [Halieaceae bacterium]